MPPRKQTQTKVVDTTVDPDLEAALRELEEAEKQSASSIVESTQPGSSEVTSLPSNDSQESSFESSTEGSVVPDDYNQGQVNPSPGKLFVKNNSNSNVVIDYAGGSVEIPANAGVYCDPAVAGSMHFRELRNSKTIVVK